MCRSILRIGRDVLLQILRRFGKITVRLVDFCKPRVELIRGVGLFESLFPDLPGAIRVITQIMDVAPRHPARWGKGAAGKSLLIGGTRPVIVFGMVMSMTRKLVKVSPPGNTLCGSLIMSGGFKIRVGAHGFVQLGIPRGNQRRAHGKREQHKYKKYTKRIATHG